MASSGLRARSRAAFLTGPTLAAFRIAGYPVLWLAGWAGGFGWAVSLVAIGWITLEVSNSAFAVGVTFAARLLPALLFGIPLGGLVDRFDRRTTLIVVNALSAASLFGVGLIAVAGHLGLTELLILSLGLGVIDTTRGTAYQSYVFDLAGPEGATNAIALGNMGGAFAGAVGSVTGGIVLEQVGVGATFWLAAAFAAAAAAGLALTGRTARLAPATPRLVPSFTRSLTLVVRNRRVALILVVVIVNEVLGFASITLLPTFTRDVLGSDAAGLGALASARAVGGIAGLLLLARIGTRNRGGRMFLLATLTSGLALTGFALSTWFGASLLLLVVVGIAWAVCDTLGQSLIQRSVEDHERGAAMGVWFFGIGFGPFGHLALGAAATVIAAPVVLAIDGIALALIALGLFSVKTLRRLP